MARLRTNPSVRVAVAPEVLKLREDGEEGGRNEGHNGRDVEDKRLRQSADSKKHGMSGHDKE